MTTPPHTIRVIGVGGAGSNAVDRMIQVGVAGVDFIAANTDVQALRHSESRQRVHLGPRATRGLGAGADPEVGARAANESSAQILEVCRDAEMVFITAGMGGGTGSGAAPAVAHLARTQGAVVIGVVTMPFTFEGAKRQRNAEAALTRLREEVDTLVVVYNDRLLDILDPQHSRMDIAFRVADECLRQAVEGITHLIHNPGMINLDFADLRSVLRNGGLGHFSLGYGQGEGAAQEAMRRALASPLLGRDGIDGAKALVVNFQGSQEMSLYDVQQAMEPVSRLVAENAPIFFGASVDDALGERVEVTLIAVGLEEEGKKARQPVPFLEVFTSPPRASAPRVSAPRASAPAPVAAPLVEPPRAEESPKILQMPEPDSHRESVGWHARSSLFTDTETTYPMDDLSIPAFLRRRRRVSA